MPWGWYPCGVYVFLVLPYAPPPLALPHVCVCRVVVAARDAHRRHDDEELTQAFDANRVDVAQDVLVARVADQVRVAKRRVQRLGECPRVDDVALSDQLRFNPVAQYVLRSRQLGGRTERGPIALVLIAKLPKRRAESRQRCWRRCLKHQRQQEGERLHRGRLFVAVDEREHRVRHRLVA